MATVLVVDDDDNNRLFVSMLLAHTGHTAIEASDGAEALTRARTDRPDLILLDLSLPTMSGAEFLQALRADPPTRSMPVALYTATQMNPALRDFMEMYGIRHAIPKPAEPQELLAAIARALDDR